MKMTMIDRLLLLAAALLAAYQIVVGIDQLSAASIVAYTVSFGVLLVSALLLIILGYDAMDSGAVVGFSTIIPLSLSLGLILDHMPALRTFYVVFAVAGLVTVLITRWTVKSALVQTIVLTIVHGIAGLTIFLLPIYAAVEGTTGSAFSLVGIGGALIGIAGLLLSFLKIGKPILAYETTLRIFPSLLFLMTACFVAGFVWG